MLTSIQIIRTLFQIYTVLLAVRIVGSWFPKIAFHPLMRPVAILIDPYLNLFRRFIPPIGGVLDLSPILAYFGLQIIQAILIKFLLMMAT